MDAHAHLLSLGWAGPGHALDSRPYKQKGHRGLAYDPNAANKPENTGNGLVKPLLISQRKARFGIGKKAHEPASGNEWWLKGFQSALQNVGKSESERSSGASTPVGLGAYNGKHTGLYGYFVKGQLMQGTISLEDEKRGKKRKSDVYEDDPLAVSEVTKQKTAKDFEDAVAFMTERDKERQRKSQKQTKSDAEQFAQIGQFFGAAEAEDENKKNKQRLGHIADDTSGTSTPLEETKEERRARRQKRREEKTRSENLSLAQMVEEELAKLRSQSDNDEEQEDVATKVARRAERKRRKAEKAAREVSIRA